MQDLETLEPVNAAAAKFFSKGHPGRVETVEQALQIIASKIGSAGYAKQVADSLNSGANVVVKISVRKSAYKLGFQVLMNYGLESTKITSLHLKELVLKNNPHE